MVNRCRSIAYPILGDDWKRMSINCVTDALRNIEFDPINDNPINFLLRKPSSVKIVVSTHPNKRWKVMQKFWHTFEKGLSIFTHLFIKFTNGFVTFSTIRLDVINIIFQSVFEIKFLFRGFKMIRVTNFTKITKN